jgi:hypothetical protein
MMIALVMLAAAMPTDDADAANLAYTQCLFATSRQASGERLPASAFEQRLANACLDEQQNLERKLAKVLASQGRRNAAAEAKGLAENARRTVADDYRRMLDLEPELRRIAEMCKANPEQCRD